MSDEDAKKRALIEALTALAKEEDEEVAHIKADGLLIAYIGDHEVKAAFDGIRKWYA